MDVDADDAGRAGVGARAREAVEAEDGDDLIARVRAWRDGDVDDGDRAELDRLLAAVAAGSAADRAELADRFAGTLAFGTAGLRGAMAAGPNRMNRAVVVRATAGLAAHLATVPGGPGGRVLVGYDARHRSDRFAADAAAVLAAAGHPVLLADRPLPTPVVAFGVRHRGCAAAVQVTASHNPPADNGYKVYLADGAQIAPPADRLVAEAIERVGPAAGVPRAPDGDPRITPVGADLVDDYVAAAVAAVDSVDAGGDPAADVRIVYTPLHGVGGGVVLAVLDRAGVAPPVVVAAQADPDPAFPTVPFPNPEEPGALDLALATAREAGADVVLANDPDADRLAVAVPDPAAAGGAGGVGAGGWRALTGDEIGVLLADWLLARGEGPDRLVATTIVSSSMVARLAAARGVVAAETLTGFKWIVRAGDDRPDLRFVYGYEEALGSCVGTLVRDKDGITAALAAARLVAHEKARGRTLVDRLDDLARELGVHATGQRSVRVAGAGGLARMAAAVERLAAAPPATLAGRPVTEVEDLSAGTRLPPTPGVVLRAEGLRLVVRPSGTEPKLKCYAQAVVPVAGDLPAARAAGAALVEALLADAASVLDLG